MTTPTTPPTQRGDFLQQQRQAHLAGGGTMADWKGGARQQAAGQWRQNQGLQQGQRADQSMMGNAPPPEAPTGPPLRGDYLNQQRDAFIQGGGNIADWRGGAKQQAVRDWRAMGGTKDQYGVTAPGEPPTDPNAPPAGGQGDSQWAGYQPGGIGSGSYGSGYGGGGSFNSGAPEAHHPDDLQYGNFDFGNVQSQIDDVYAEQQRLMEPQKAQMNRRHEQDLINKGIDPNSEQGQQMLQNLQRGQAEMDTQAQAAAMGFGTNLQNQMFQQGLAGRGQDIQKYLGELGNQAQWGQIGLGQGQLDLARQGQDWNQMMGLDAVNFRNRGYNDAQGRYEDQLIMSLMGANPMGGGTPIDAMGAYGMNSQRDTGLLGKLGM